MDHHGSVAIAVDAHTVDAHTVDAHTAGDRVLAEAVRRRGGDVRPLVWGTSCDPRDLVVIRSTWDYVERPDEFRSWLDDLDAAGNTVVNSTALLRWNMHKGYLAELAARGVSGVPTAMVPAVSTGTLGEVMAANGWGQVVVKPAIGASARQTFRVDRAGQEAAEPPRSSTRRRRGCAGATVEGELHLMELELIEPELSFELAPEATDRLADLLVSG